MANEKRLIDLDKAFGAINQEVWWTESEKAYFRSFLAKQPKVDAVEVVHGRWLNWRGEPIMPDDYWRLWRCSVCNNEWEYPKAVDADEVSFHYCPNCGAKMDGDGND